MAIFFVVVFMFVFSKGIEVLNSTNSYDIKYDGPDKTPAEKWLPFTKKEKLILKDLIKNLQLGLLIIILISTSSCCIFRDIQYVSS
jgi:hypothetical protein